MFVSTLLMSAAAQAVMPGSGYLEVRAADNSEPFYILGLIHKGTKEESVKFCSDAEAQDLPTSQFYDDTYKLESCMVFFNPGVDENKAISFFKTKKSQDDGLTVMLVRTADAADGIDIEGDEIRVYDADFVAQ